MAFSNVSHQIMIWLTSIVSRSKTKPYKRQKNNKLALNSWTQTYQILRNNNEVCIPSLSSILIAENWLGKKVENYLFEVEKHVKLPHDMFKYAMIRIFFAQNWFYNNMWKKPCYIIKAKIQLTIPSSLSTKTCSSFNQSLLNSKFSTNEIIEEQKKIYWYILDLVCASYFKYGLMR